MYRKIYLPTTRGGAIPFRSIPHPKEVITGGDLKKETEYVNDPTPSSTAPSFSVEDLGKIKTKLEKLKPKKSKVGNINFSI